MSCEETVEAITDQDRRVPGQFLAFPPIVAGKDQQCSGRRVFAQEKCPLDQRLVDGQQNELEAALLLTCYFAKMRSFCLMTMPSLVSMSVLS